MSGSTIHWFKWDAKTWDGGCPIHEKVTVEVCLVTGAIVQRGADVFEWGLDDPTPIVSFRLVEAPDEKILENAFRWCVFHLDKTEDPRLPEVSEAPPMPKVKPPKKHGGSSPNQYRVSLELPLTNDRTEFKVVDLEVMDVCEAWGFQQEEHNIFKAFARNGKKDSGDVNYDARKVLLFALRYAKREGAITHAEFWQHCKQLGL